MYYPIKSFQFRGLMEAKQINYKYSAILYNQDYDRLIYIHFGNKYETHYRDTTGLNSYSHLDSNNLNYRIEKITELSNLVKLGYYSSAYFELKYLYSYTPFLIQNKL
jgi:hypothetical protein